MADQPIGAHVLISGRVQGVGFRFFAQRRAAEHAVTGYVRNLPDGRVEVVAVGAAPSLHAYIDVLRQGPPVSHVRECITTWQENPEPFSQFTIRS